MKLAEIMKIINHYTSVSIYDLYMGEIIARYNGRDNIDDDLKTRNVLMIEVTFDSGIKVTIGD